MTTAVMIAPIPEEIWTIAQIRARWAARTTATRSLTSEKWQREQENYIWLLAFAQADREAIFAALRDARDWKYKTCEKYWSALLAGAMSIDAKVTAAMKAQQAVFHFLAMEELPARPTIPADPQEVEAAASRLETQGFAEEALALRVAYLLGQRMGDVLNLNGGSTDVLFDPKSGMWFVTILFRKTKTSRTCQPYSLHIPREEAVGKNLQQFAQDRKSQQYLFMDDEGRFEQRKLQGLQRIKAALQSVNNGLSVLSIRRGGLQVMALAGLSTECLLAHSRHRQVENLHRYLEWGKLMLNPARERWNMGGAAKTGCSLTLTRTVGSTGLHDAAHPPTDIADFERLEIGEANIFGQGRPQA
jgi:hypothetical protein